MLYKDYTEELLGLKDVFVKNIEKDEKSIRIHLECKKQMQVCRHCYHETSRIHSYRIQKVKDISYAGLATILLLRKSRYYCPHCNKVFQENLPFLEKYKRNTNRLIHKIIDDFKYKSSTKDIAKRNNVSVGVATAAFASVSYPLPKLPKVLSIDEFKGNAGGHKYQCILTDPAKRKALDILPSRNSDELRRYFDQFPIAARRNVNYVVIDMSKQFNEIMTAYFPKSKIVIDKFHVCRYISWALEAVRKSEQKKFHENRRKYFKRSRWILLKRGKDLKEDDLLQLENMLSLSKPLREAYALKEAFYDFAHCKDIFEAKKLLHRWNLLVGLYAIPEFTKCFEMINRWQAGILRGFELGYTNGYTEGYNNKIKVLKRVCFGVKNFNRFRNRILHLETLS